MISPLYSAGERTSTSAFFALPSAPGPRRACARSVLSALWPCSPSRGDGTSVVIGRLSSSHFLRPPSISLRFLWPYISSTQNA